MTKRLNLAASKPVDRRTYIEYFENVDRQIMSIINCERVGWDKETTLERADF